MAKKGFTGGLSSLLGDRPTAPEQPRPIARETATAEKEPVKAASSGTKPNETRATFIVNEDLLEKLKAIAYWDRMLIKDVINNALAESVSRYQDRHGEIKAVPEK
ncbi:MAG: hypothetical protein V4543_17935 [Bacteroidota bacterium]